MSKFFTPHTNWSHPNVGDGYVHPDHQPGRKIGRWTRFQVEIAQADRREFNAWVRTNDGIPTKVGAIFVDPEKATLFKLFWQDNILSEA